MFVTLRGTPSSFFLAIRYDSLFLDFSFWRKPPALTPGDVLPQWEVTFQFSQLQSGHPPNSWGMTAPWAELALVVHATCLADFFPGAVTDKVQLSSLIKKPVLQHRPFQKATRRQMKQVTVGCPTSGDTSPNQLLHLRPGELSRSRHRRSPTARGRARWLCHRAF